MVCYFMSINKSHNDICKFKNGQSCPYGGVFPSCLTNHAILG